jgi:colanic acid biosynthesis glycosyl transferase WcaI
MRILLINQYFPPDASNSAYILGELAEDLAHDHDVQIIAGRPSYEADTGAYVPHGVSVRRVRSTQFSRKSLLGRAFNYLTFLLFAALAALTSPRPDVVVTMTDPPMAGLLGVVGSRRHGTPFVLLLHDVYPDIAVALGVLAPGRVATAWRALNRLVRRSAARIVVVGRDMAEKLESEGVASDRLMFVPTWSPDFGVDEEDRRRARSEAGWDGRFIVMHAGNQGLAQNVLILADLAERLRAETDIEVVILGDGAGLPELKRTCAERGLRNLTFLSHRPKPEAQRLMRAADVHVVSLVPGLWGCAVPSKIYGIMAAGRPFVAAVDTGSEPDRIVAEHGCGIRVTAGDSEGLAEAVISLKGANLEPLAKRSREAFERVYTRTVATQQVERLLRELAVASRRQRPGSL